MRDLGALFGSFAAGTSFLLARLCADAMMECATVPIRSSAPICTMAKISISEASRRTGKPRSTLHRHIRTGKLSREFDELGNPIIDMSELERVYGHLLPPDMEPDGAPLQSAPGNRTTLDIGVHIELEALKRENVLLRDERDDLRRRLDGEAEERRRLTALLTDHRSKKRQSWWPWG